VPTNQMKRDTVEAGDWLLGSDVTEKYFAIIVYISIDLSSQLADSGEDALYVPLCNHKGFITVSMFLFMFLLQYLYVHIKINFIVNGVQKCQAIGFRL
jgi:hypothetical protein